MSPWLRERGIDLSDDEIIRAFLEIDGALCRLPYIPYREVLRGIVEAFGQKYGIAVTEPDRDLLMQSVPSWSPFPDTVDVLQALGRKYRLAIISNIDNDLIVKSTAQLGVKFGAVVTAEQARCYKPNPDIFRLAFARLDVEPRHVIHIAEGADEVRPAKELGCMCVWVRRRGRSARLLSEAPDFEVPDLSSLQVALRSDDRLI